MFISLLTPFDTKDSYYSKSNLRLVLLISVSYKKACNVVSKSSKNEEIIFPREFILVFVPYFIGAIPYRKKKEGGYILTNE